MRNRIHDLDDEDIDLTDEELQRLMDWVERPSYEPVSLRRSWWCDAGLLAVGALVGSYATIIAWLAAMAWGA